VGSAARDLARGASPARLLTMLTMLTSWIHPADECWRVLTSWTLIQPCDCLSVNRRTLLTCWAHPPQVSVTWVQPRVISREALGKRVARLEEWMDKVIAIPKLRAKCRLITCLSDLQTLHP